MKKKWYIVLDAKALAGVGDQVSVKKIGYQVIGCTVESRLLNDKHLVSVEYLLMGNDRVMVYNKPLYVSYTTSDNQSVTKYTVKKPLESLLVAPFGEEDVRREILTQKKEYDSMAKEAKKPLDSLIVLDDELVSL